MGHSLHRKIKINQDQMRIAHNIYLPLNTGKQDEGSNSQTSYSQTKIQTEDSFSKHRVSVICELLDQDPLSKKPQNSAATWSGFFETKTQAAKQIWLQLSKQKMQ